jgi:hypothetical protein
MARVAAQRQHAPAQHHAQLLRRHRCSSTSRSATAGARPPFSCTQSGARPPFLTSQELAKCFVGRSSANGRVGSFGERGEDGRAPLARADADAGAPHTRPRAPPLGFHTARSPALVSGALRELYMCRAPHRAPRRESAGTGPGGMKRRRPVRALALVRGRAGEWAVRVFARCCLFRCLTHQLLARTVLLCAVGVCAGARVHLGFHDAEAAMDGG